jgi:hypothetical protein
VQSMDLFFAEGDGNFSPEILYNGHGARQTDIIDKETKWRGDEYRIDFDSIAWQLHDREDIVKYEIKRFNKFSILYYLLLNYKKFIISNIKYKIKNWRLFNGSSKYSKK